MAKVNIHDVDRDIEKMFIQDIREKKRAGNGSFSRSGKGSSKGRVRGGMKTHADFLKGKEKREYTKPGKIEVFNMKDIISKQAYFQKSEADQKTLLSTWRENYKNDEILEKMGINKTDYYNLVHKFGLKKQDRGNLRYIQKEKYSLQDMERLLKDCTYEEFVKATTPQKAILLESYDDRFTMDELQDYWGVNKSQIYSHRYGIKKWKIKQGLLDKEGNPIEASETPQEAQETKQEALPLDEPEKPEIEETEPPQAEKEIVPEPIQEQIPDPIERKIPKFKFSRQEKKTEKEPQPETKPEATGSDYRISGIYTSDELSEKLDKINLLISDENSNFEISLNIREIRKTDEEKAENDNKEKLEKLMSTLAELVPSMIQK